MSVTLTLDAVLEQDNDIVRRYTVLPAGSYVNGTGETIDFTKALNPKFASRPFPPQPPGGALPAASEAIVASTPGGYDAVLTQAGANPTLKNFVLKYYTSGGTELGSGAYPAGLTAGNTIITVTTSRKYS